MFGRRAGATRGQQVDACADARLARSRQRPMLERDELRIAFDQAHARVVRGRHAHDLDQGAARVHGQQVPGRGHQPPEDRVDLAQCAAAVGAQVEDDGLGTGIFVQETFGGFDIGRATGKQVVAHVGNARRQPAGRLHVGRVALHVVQSAGAIARRAFVAGLRVGDHVEMGVRMGALEIGEQAISQRLAGQPVVVAGFGPGAQRLRITLADFREDITAGHHVGQVRGNVPARYGRPGLHGIGRLRHGGDGAQRDRRGEQDGTNTLGQRVHGVLP